MYGGYKIFSLFCAKKLNMYKRYSNTPEKSRYFKRWKNKGYAVFTSMGVHVVISVLLVPYLIFSPERSQASGTDTTEITINRKIDEIEVTAQRSTEVYPKIARIVTVISSAEIEAAPVNSLNELLEYVAGIDIRQRGMEDVQSDVSVRGGTFDQTLVLLNGINITDPQTGHHNMNLPVALEQIERIEILEGPAARVYGPNAFSGAINIITKTPQKNEMALSLEAGSFKYIYPSVSAGIRFKNQSHSFAVNYKKSDGHIQNTDFKIGNLFYKMQVDNKLYRLTIQSGYTLKDFGANSFYTPKYPEQFESLKTFFSSAKFETMSRVHFTTSAYLRSQNDRFELFRNSAPSWYSGHNYHHTDCYGINTGAWFKWAPGKTSFGADVRVEQIFSNVLGDKLDAAIKVKGSEAWYTKSKSRVLKSFYAEHSFTTEKIALSAGFLLHSYTDNPNPAIFPGFEAAYMANKQLRVFISYNTSLRLPTFTDLYYSGPTNLGNPDLKPEKSDMAEIGLRFNRKWLRSDLLFFSREGRNIIDWTKTNASDKWQSQNLTKVNSMGVETNWEINLADYHWKWAPTTLKISYLYLNLSKDNSGFISYYVLDNLKNKLNISVVKRIGQNLVFNLNSTYQQREGTYTSFVNGMAGVEKPYDPFVIFDAKIIYSLKNFRFSLSSSNIFDTWYIDYGNIQQPGRIVRAGIKFNI